MSKFVIREGDGMTQGTVLRIRREVTVRKVPL